MVCFRNVTVNTLRKEEEEEEEDDDDDDDECLTPNMKALRPLYIR